MTDPTTPACRAPTSAAPLDASLRRLGVDVIDLYQAHAWDPLTPIEETLGFFADAVRAGKIRYAGVSNFVGWQLQKAALLADDAAPIVTLQPQYNLLVRDIELEIVDVCRNEGIGILPWSPLAGGWLTGKYARDEVPSGASRLGENPDRGMEAYGPRNAQERTWRVIDAVGSIAEGRGVSMSQVALAWVADRPAVTSVILGARTIAQLDDNLGAADLHLSPEETALLSDASAPQVSDYPYGQPGIDQRAASCRRPIWSPTFSISRIWVTRSANETPRISDKTAISRAWVTRLRFGRKTALYRWTLRWSGASVW